MMDAATREARIAALEAELRSLRAGRDKTRVKTRTVEHFTPDDLVALFAALPFDTVGRRRDRAAIMLMEGAGLRIGECVALLGSSVRFADGVMLVTVPATDGCKTGARTVPVSLSHPCVAPVREWLAERGGGDAPLFPSANSKPLHVNQLYRSVREAGERAGIHAHPHMLRHTYASRKLTEGYTLQEVRELLGHKDIRTTGIYLHANPTHLIAKERAL